MSGLFMTYEVLTKPRLNIKGDQAFSFVVIHSQQATVMCQTQRRVVFSMLGYFGNNVMETELLYEELHAFWYGLFGH